MALLGLWGPSGQWVMEPMGSINGQMKPEIGLINPEIGLNRLSNAAVSSYARACARVNGVPNLQGSIQLAIAKWIDQIG